MEFQKEQKIVATWEEITFIFKLWSMNFPKDQSILFPLAYKSSLGPKSAFRNSDENI